MDIIRLLPDSVANQIAAGEVIQRPASCLKELVENALDAGATSVQVIVRDAGRTMLQVIDNGSGMSETDVRMAFERHATSKIREASDLFGLRTMGFRGEALPSICAVSQVEVQTRTADAELGSLLEISGSEVVRQEPVQCAVGTNIRVRNLFFNVPARRKFLKTDQTELRNLLSEFYRIVLVYPKVHFLFVHQDEVLHDLPEATEKQRLEALFGGSSRQPFTSQLVDIMSDTALVSLRGFVGKPEAAGKTAKQYFFVNGRYMRHPYFHKAVLSAYEGMLPPGVQPSYFIYFDIAPDAIDVNIHPTKTEIKFADEQLIYPILLAAVREALGKFNLSPSLDFDNSGRVEMPVFPSRTGILSEPETTAGSYNPFKSSGGSLPSVQGWQQLYQPASLPREMHSSPSSDSLLDMAAMLGQGSKIQVFGKYILTCTEDGLVFIHQHRAHVCILYDLCQKRIAGRNGERQQLLFPEVWDVDAEDVMYIEGMQDELSALGFDIERIAPYSFSVCAVPAMMQGAQTLSTLQSMLSLVKQTGMSARKQWQEKIALSMAESAAIASGKILTAMEMDHLCEQLFRLPSYRFTPDGKLVVVSMTSEEIDRRF